MKSSGTGFARPTRLSLYAVRKTPRYHASRIERGESSTRMSYLSLLQFLKPANGHSVSFAFGICESHTKSDSTISLQCTKPGIMLNCTSNSSKSMIAYFAQILIVKRLPSFLPGTCISRATQQVYMATTSSGRPVGHDLTNSHAAMYT